MHPERSLRTSREFRRVLDEGSAARRGDVAVHVLRREDGGRTRLGLAVRSAPGGAVVRNRAKRRLRAAFDALSDPRSYDVVVRGSDRCARADFQELAENLSEALERAGMGRPRS